MARITVEDCLTKETNRFALVLLASKRTKQILRGGKTLVTDSKNKAVVTALREIAAGKVRFMTEEERLAEIRKQIARYDEALERHDMGAGPAMASARGGGNASTGRDATRSESYRRPTARTVNVAGPAASESYGDGAPDAAQACSNR